MDLKWACSRNLLPVVLESCLAWALILSPYRYTECVYVSGFWEAFPGAIQSIIQVYVCSFAVGSLSQKLIQAIDEAVKLWSWNASQIQEFNKEHSFKYF
jgi:hypothetical protein